MVYRKSAGANMNHHHPSNMSATGHSSCSGSAGSFNASCLHGSASTNYLSGAKHENHHNFGLNLHYSASNNSNGISLNNHLPLNQQNSNSQHLSNRNRQQILPVSTAAALAAINSHLTQHSRHSFNSSNNNRHPSHHHNQASNSHHHPLGSLSNSSAASSSSSSPSASASPTSIAPVTSLQQGNLISASGLAIGFNQNHQLAANNLQQQQQNNSNSTLQIHQQQQNTSRYKTELCRPFEENGTCKYGEKCQFAHGVSELRTLTRHPKYKTEFCRTFHTTGFCPYGPRCHFIHNSKTSAAPASISLNNYANLPFGQHASHSASPSTSPISSSSTTTTVNGSASSASSITSSSSVSPPSPTKRLLDMTVGGCTTYSYEMDGNLNHLIQEIF